jgi:aspartyl-tRNA(Asn)/glutamyl-tRNA(Gln) amidotransferase subunit C
LKITDKEVRYVAGLANLTLTEDEIGRMVHDLDEILTHIDKLNELDTADVAPMAQVLHDASDTATLRADVEVPSLPNELAVGNAVKSGGGYFKVPLVIER